MSERNPSTTSFTDFRESKGLDNHKGQNNCWLNATIQLLWHQDGFRESLHRLKSRGHYKCRREQCVYCQIQRLLKKYIYENNQSIPPDELREALTQVNQSFVAGEMGDPIEAYETVLKVLHVHLTGEDNSKSPCEKEHCLVHQKFHHNIVEERTCDKCYDTQYQIESELSKWVSARDVINLPNYTPFMKLFKNSGPGNDCSRNNCIGKYNLIKRLENAAESFVISVGWDSQRTPLNDITIFINKVPCRMKIDDLYDQITDDSSIDSELLLNGIVCYYGMHYTAYIFHTKMKKWVYLDDNNVNVISSSWINVMNHMTKNYQQPCMLLYSKLDKFKKLNLENALRKEETTYDNDFSPQKIAVADDFTNRAMKEKEDQELKDAAFAKQLMEEEEKRLKEFEMQQKLEAERKHQEAIERQRRQLEIERQEAEKLRLKQEEERIKKIREQEIELRRYEQEKKRKDEAERQRLAEEERKRRLVEEENKRRLAEVERREKEKKEVEEIMRRAKQKEEDDKRRQEAEDRDRKEKLKKAEWERLEYQRRLGVAGSYSGSQKPMDNNHIEGRFTRSYNPKKYPDEWNNMIDNERRNQKNADQLNNQLYPNFNDTLPPRVDLGASHVVRASSRASPRHHVQSPTHSVSSSYDGRKVEETLLRDSMTQSQSKTKKSVVDRPGPSSHHQEEDLIGFGLNHLQHANGTASLGHSAGVVSNLKNKGKKFIDGIFNNSRSKHLETFPDYNPDRPDAVSRKPTGSMQRKQMSGVLHLSEGKHRTNGNGLRPASSNSSIDSRPPWK